MHKCTHTSASSSCTTLSSFLPPEEADREDLQVRHNTHMYLGKQVLSTHERSESLDD